MRKRVKKPASEPAQPLQPLRRCLPDVPDKPVIDEDGEEFFPGFNGDVSQSPLYVTDGHLLLLKGAIDPEVVINNRNPDHWTAKHATEEAIRKVWNDAMGREEGNADFIGGCDGPFDGIAFVCDVLGRVTVVSGHKLAFALKAVHLDKLTVSKKFFNRWPNDPLALWRDGNLVGLLMPIRVSAAELFAHYDLHGEPVNLVAPGGAGDAGAEREKAGGAAGAGAEQGVSTWA
jgi:hypothetical protein